MKIRNLKSRNIPLIFLMEIIGGMLFFLPILALYLEQSLFSLTNVALIFTVESIAIVLLEMPTGAFADLFGRKKTIISAQIAVLIAIVFLLIGDHIIFFLLYAVFNALGRSLASGTYSAFVYDTLKEIGKEHHFKKVIGTLFAFWPLGASIGAIIGGYLASINYSYAVSASLIPIAIVFFVSLFLKEPKYEKEDHRNIGKQIINSIKFISHNKTLLLMFAAGAIALAIGEPIHMLESIFLNFNKIPIKYFGYVTALVYGLSSLGHYLSHSVSEKFSDKGILITASVVSPILLLLATYSSGLFLVGFLVIPAFFFGLKNPVVSHVINESVSSGKRATVLSVSNFVNEMGIALMAPVIGYAADLYDINVAIRLGALALLIVPIFYLFLKTTKK